MRSGAAARAGRPVVTGNNAENPRAKTLRRVISDMVVSKFPHNRPDIADRNVILTFRYGT
jgi:hypothetical protein